MSLVLLLLLLLQINKTGVDDVTDELNELFQILEHVFSRQVVVEYVAQSIFMLLYFFTS